MGKKFERELRGRMISLEELEEWKKKRDAVILAHYYVRPEVQALADYIGDSYFLSKKATELANKTIVLCGVTFMGESAKLLNPDKTVLMPDLAADCPMAHMVTKKPYRPRETSTMTLRSCVISTRHRRSNRGRMSV